MFVDLGFPAVRSASFGEVDIGDMSRNWKSSEALLLDDDYTWAWRTFSSLN